MSIQEECKTTNQKPPFVESGYGPETGSSSYKPTMQASIVYKKTLQSIR